MLLGFIGLGVLSFLFSTESHIAAATDTCVVIYSRVAACVRARDRVPESLRELRGEFAINEELLIDPWGNEYVYTPPVEDRPYEIQSLGSDGRPGGEGAAADIKLSETKAR